jgi:apolipoprotein N-acyltransferase
MVSVNLRKVSIAVLVLACFFILIWFGNGLNPVWPLMWFAMLPVLWFALRSSWPSAALIAVLSMILGGLNMLHYLHGVLGVPISMWIGIYAVVGIVFGTGVLLFRRLVLRGAVWSALIALPALWVSMEYSRLLTTPHGTAGSLAYTQLKFLPYLQLASVTGPWGMSFFLLLLQSAIAIGIYLWPTERGQAIRVMGMSLIAIVAILIFGAIRLASPQGQTIRVGLIASDARANLVPPDPGEATQRLFRDYAIRAGSLVAQGAQVIVMPEKIGVVVEPETRPMDEALQTMADRTGVAIVAGVVRVAKPLKYNEARIYVPHRQVASYDKQHMLPPFESDLEPGKSLTFLPNQHAKLGLAICKDMDFGDPARSYGETGVGIMLVPAWDFVIDNAWHGHIAVMRGVEGGFSIARAAKTGYLTVSDSRGRIVAETRSDSAPFATLIADVPVQHYETLYQRLGDWFARGSVGLLIWVLVRALWR